MIFSLIVFAFIFIIGLVVGSFMNVVILRTVSEESIVFPGSKCPKCQTPLKWYHNIPVFSYIFLRGKCAFCHEHISWQYPLVELLTGFIFVVLFLKYCRPIDPLFGLNAMNPISLTQVLLYLFAVIVSCLFIAIAGTDIIEKKVSDAHTLSLVGVGIGYSVIMAIINFVFYTKANGLPKFDLHLLLSCPIIYSLAGAIVGFLIMEAISRLGILLVGSRAFGEGDSYIAAGLGAVFGAYLGCSPLYENFLPIFLSLVAILVLSFVIQIIFTLPIFLKKLVVNKNWLTLGAILTFIVYTIGYIFAQNLNWLKHPVAYWSSTIVLVIIGLLTCRELICGLKEHHSEGLYLPFGPAMILAGFIALLTLAI